MELEIRNASYRRTEEGWFDLRGAADTDLYQISHSLSVQPQKERDASRRVRRSTWLSFSRENRLCMWGTLLWGVTCCGLGDISSLYHPAGPHCHTADLGYLNLTKLSGLPILLRERLKLDRYF